MTYRVHNPKTRVQIRGGDHGFGLDLEAPTTKTTKGLVITKIENDSPIKDSIEVNSIIIEAQKKKINSKKDLEQIVKQFLNSDQKTILLVIYNSQNQRRYIGIKVK